MEFQEKWRIQEPLLTLQTSRSFKGIQEWVITPTMITSKTLTRSVESRLITFICDSTSEILS